MKDFEQNHKTEATTTHNHLRHNMANTLCHRNLLQTEQRAIPLKMTKRKLTLT